MQKNFVGVVLLVACVCVASLAMAEKQSSLLDPNLDPVFYPLPENVEVLRLENGLEVILMHNPAQPMAGIFTQVRVGSAWEDFRTSGMSHMLEHLLFNGSSKYTQEEQYDMADRAGAYNNANTTDFFTNYMMVIPAKNLETGFELQSEMLFHSIIPEEKFAKEKGIVIGEIVQGRDWPGHETEVAMRQALYGGTSLELPTLGTKSTIEHMVRDDVYDFYRKWYVPNNMILTLAGNFEREEALEMLEKYYGSVAPGTLDKTGLKTSPYISKTTSVTRRAGDQRVLALSFEAPTYGMDEFFPFLVMAQLLDLEGSGVLTRALADVDDEIRPSFSWGWEKAPGFGRLTMHFSLKEKSDPSALYRLVQDALTGAIESGIDEADILGIVRMSETHTLLEREQLRMTGIYIAEPVAIGGADFFVSYLEQLAQVSTEEVTRAMTNWLIDAPCEAILIESESGNSEDPMAAMGMPEGMKMPPAMLAAMKKQGMSMSDMGMGEAEGEKPAAEESAPAPLQVDRTELANGAVLISQTNSDSPLMAIHLTIRGRAMVDQENAHAGALDLVHRMLTEGYSGCDDVCLARRLRELGAVVKLVDDDRIPMDNYYTNGRFSFIRIELSSQYGPEMLEMLIREIQHAAFDKDDFERERIQRIEAMKDGQASARSVANRTLDEILYGDHPLVLPAEGDAESLASLNFNQVRQVYRKAFSPENLIFSIVGPYPHEEMRALIEEKLPGRGKPVTGLPALPVVSESSQVRKTVGGELSAIRLGTIIPVAEEDQNALKLVTAIMSDRMAMDLRETRGLSYSVGASFSVRSGQGEFISWLNPPVERMDEGLVALREFIANFDASSITQDELDKIRSARTGRQMMRRLSSMGQAYYLAMAELTNDIPGYLNALTAYDDVTLENLVTAAEKYLKTMPLVEVVVD
ncbi:MAG: insulinase family protein [bacterium]|nr:insulinase family protein [bacterium]